MYVHADSTLNLWNSVSLARHSDCGSSSAVCLSDITCQSLDSLAVPQLIKKIDTDDNDFSVVMRRSEQSDAYSKRSLYDRQAHRQTDNRLVDQHQMSNAAIGTLAGHEGPYLKVSVEVEARKWQVWGPAAPILPQTKQTPPLLTKPTKTNPNHDAMYSCADVVVHLWMTSTVCAFLCGCRYASMDVRRQSWVLVLRCLPPFGWHRSLTGTFPQLDQVQEHPVFAPASHHCWVCAPCQLLPWIVGIRTQVLKFESQVFYWLSISPATQKPWLLTKKKNTGSIWHPHFQLIRGKNFTSGH